MGTLSSSLRTPVMVSVAIFAILAPITVDIYNATNYRTFLDLWLVGNPYSLRSSSMLSYGEETWALDWPYPPLAMLFVAPAWLLFRLFGSEVIYQVVFKLPLFLSALATVWLLARLILLQGGTPRQARWAAFFFLLNPGIIVITAIVGLFEAPTILLMMLAYWWWAAERRIVLSGLALGLAIALRLYPIVLLPVFLIEAWRRGGFQPALAYFLAVLAPVVVTFLPFVLWDAQGLWNTLFLYHTSAGPFSTLVLVGRSLLLVLLLLGKQVTDDGLGGFLILLTLGFIFLTIMGLEFVYIFVFSKRPPIVQGILAALLVFFLFYPRVNGHYILAVLPFALLQSNLPARWVWVPGATWLLLLNGAFGSYGLLYWFSWLGGREWDTYALLGLPGGLWRGIASLLLMSAQAFLVAFALWVAVRKRAGAQSTGVTKLAPVGLP